MNRTGHYWIIGEMDGNIWIHYLCSFFLVVILYEVFRKTIFIKRSERLFHAIMCTFVMGALKEVIIDPHGEIIDLVFNVLGICMAMLSIIFYQQRNRVSGYRKYPLDNLPHTTIHRSLSPNKIKELNEKIALIFKRKG